AVTSVEGVKQISSTSRQGNANITVEFEISRNIDAALQDIQTRVAQAARRLPREIDPPIITKTNPEDSPIMWLSISGTRSPVFMADYVRNVIRPQLQTIEGVGEVFIGGYRERNVRVWFDAPRLEAQGLTVLDINDAIQREHLEVAVVEDGLEDRRRVARANGEPSIGFGIRKLRGANAVDVGHRAKEKLKQIQADLPEGVNVGVRFDSTIFIERAIDEILRTLI